MRQLTDHIVSGDQAVQLAIVVTDQPGAGGANHRYIITGGVAFERNPSFDPQIDDTGDMTVLFQNGPIKEAGVNGITQEVLLAIVIDRLRCFQNGPFNCDDNNEAIEGCIKALHALQRRTVARIKRGVEGTNQQ